MNRHGKKIVILLVIAFLLIVATVVWIAVQRTSGDSIVRDKDTGETFDPKAPRENTGGNGSLVSTVQLFGIEQAIKSLSGNESIVGYSDDIKASIWQFSHDRLNNEFQTITLRPQNLEQKDATITGELRLGQSDTIIPIVIKPTSTERHAIISINNDNNAYGGTFVYMGGINNPDNLLFTIEQVSRSSDKLRVISYGGYNEAALEYLESIGYHIPDLDISFAVESGML